MITAKQIKSLYETFKISRDENERAYDAWEADLENEELEAASDEAYNAMWDALNAFAEGLESFTDGQVDQTTAKLMARNPKYASKLEYLIEMLEA